MGVLRRGVVHLRSSLRGIEYPAHLRGRWITVKTPLQRKLVWIVN